MRTTTLIEAIEAIEAAALYPEDEHYLIDGASSVTHYDVIDRADLVADPGLGPGRAPLMPMRRDSRRSEA